MKTINAENAPNAVGPYSHAVTHNDMVFASGQIPLSPETNEMVEGIENQTKQVLENLKAVLEAANSSLDNALKVTIFVTDLAHFQTVNEIYGQYFTQKPARACVQVAALPKGALIEMDVVAVTK